MLRLKPPARKLYLAQTVENRFHVRLPIKNRLSIYYDNAGIQQYVRARGINLSGSGALVEIDQPMSVGSTVYIRANDFDLMGTASVRHCILKGSKFRVCIFRSPYRAVYKDARILRPCV
jgi:hypothetical protein